MKNLFFAALLGSTSLVTSAAVAQQQTSQDTVQPQTQQTGQDTTQALQTGQNADQQQATGGEMKVQDGFIIAQQQDQMVASNLMDANVIGADNESIGEVEDLLLDRQGRVVGVAVGVGGFLGIGEKDVAIPADALDFVLVGDPEALGTGTAATVQPGAPRTTATDTTAQPGVAGTPGAMSTAASDAAGATGTTGDTMQAGTTGTDAPGVGGVGGVGGAAQTGTMGMTGTTVTATDSPRIGPGWRWTGGQIDHIRVDFTREQLDAAPEFSSAED